MLSQTSEYALRAMVHLAALEDGGAMNSETIAARTKVPQGYLSKVLRDLVVADLIASQRGPNGGFALARPADKITMLDVINAVDPMMRIRRCPLGNPEHVKLCPLHQRIDDAIEQIETQFRKTSLSEVLESSRKPGERCVTLMTPTVRSRKA
ncbi:MAG: transcriptional regulator [Phycisphaerae bacterium]|nr:MAG: transcriptional regulator [Phycisphaerae bacterium]